MAVTPLTNRPVPPNSNFARAMFVWVTATAAQDPLDTDTDQQSLINFCGTVGCNVIFLDIWQYLGGSNWTNAKRDKMRQFVDRAKRSGCKVYALCGNVDWAVNQAWVMKNIINPIAAFNAMAQDVSGCFDGVIFDVEYWTDEAGYPAVTNLPAFCDLVKATKATTNLEVGCFAAFYLKDATGTRPDVSYAGKSAQDGEHMMDVCDFVVVGAYRNHAEDNSTDGPGQIPLLQPWYDYASAQGKNFGLYCGSETISITPSYATYFGMTKAAMEAQHTLISSQFRTPINATFLGQCVHSYDGWKALT
ncbi:MAG: hypothetical protein ACREJC_06540 [Tepidisphaeraceae bacterium]